jgi:hypothetical protein
MAGFANSALTSNENYTKKFRLAGKTDDRPASCGWQFRVFIEIKGTLFELAHVLVCLGHITSDIVNAKHGVGRS